MINEVVVLKIWSVVLGICLVCALIFVIIDSGLLLSGQYTPKEIKEVFSEEFDYEGELSFEKVFNYYDKYSEDNDCLYKTTRDSVADEGSFKEWDDLPIELSEATGSGINKRSKQFLDKYFLNGKYKEKEISSSHSGRGEYSLAVFDSDTGTLYYYRLKTG